MLEVFTLVVVVSLASVSEVVEALGGSQLDEQNEGQEVGEK